LVSSYFSYIIITDKVGDGERVFITNEVPDTICDVCSPTGPGPNDNEYHMMSGMYVYSTSFNVAIWHKVVFENDY
jgi:hypothetical protein